MLETMIKKIEEDISQKLERQRQSQAVATHRDVG